MSACAYEIDCSIEPVLRKLEDESLARLCLGAFAADGVSSIVGNSALHVAGAAGETTDRLSALLEGRYLVLADGPAGLSLSPQWVRNEDGTVRSVMEHESAKALERAWIPFAQTGVLKSLPTLCVGTASTHA